VASHPSDLADVGRPRPTPVGDLGAAFPGPRSPRSAALTVRERVVLARLAEGRRTDEVAELLHLSPHTVRSRVKTILRKLGARNREHAVAIAMRESAIDPDL
jgi:DNA-binding CsgD family transcriptional regulator